MQSREILEDQLSESPEQLDVEKAAILYEAAELNELMYVAHQRRLKQVPGEHVTYLVDRNINYTNICTINCQFCSFYRTPGHKEAYTQGIEEISERISQLESIGGTRILMQGGVNPDLPLEWYLETLTELSSRHPSISLDCFSPIEIEGIADVCNLSTLEVLTKLHAAGLHGLPGGGAEMLVDEIRLSVSPSKGSAENWLRIMGEAQEIGLVTSATNVFGFGENFVHRLEHMEKIRNLQNSAISSGFPGFTSFISWPVMLENNSLGRGNKGRNMYTLGSSASEYLRHVSISRLFLDNIDHIQSSWPTMGIEVSQMALNGGADDIGSTMMEENVVSASGSTKTMATEDELRQAISQSGFKPVARDSEYNLLNLTPSIQ